MYRLDTCTYGWRHGETRTAPPVRYLQLTHNEWDPATKTSRPKVLHSFGREDQLDRDAIKRLVASLTRLLNPATALTGTTTAGSDGSGVHLVAPGRRHAGAGRVVAPAGDRHRHDPAAGRPQARPAHRAGAVRAGREPGAGAGLEAGRRRVGQPARAHRRPGRDLRRRLLPGDGLAARHRPGSGAGGVLAGRHPARSRGRPAVLRHHLHLLRDRRTRRAGRPRHPRPPGPRPAARHHRGRCHHRGRHRQRHRQRHRHGAGTRPGWGSGPTASRRTPATTCPRS